VSADGESGLNYLEKKGSDVMFRLNGRRGGAGE